MKLVKGPNINLQHSLSKDPIGDRCVHLSVKPEYSVAILVNCGGMPNLFVCPSAKWAKNHCGEDITLFTKNPHRETMFQNFSETPRFAFSWAFTNLWQAEIWITYCNLTHKLPSVHIHKGRAQSFELSTVNVFHLYFMSTHGQLHRNPPSCVVLV